MAYEKVSLENILVGAVTEKFEYELKKVKANITDPNTDWKKAREITIKIRFSPNEDRNKLSTTASVASKLCPVKDSVGVISMTQQNGKLEMFQEMSQELPLFPDDEMEVMDIKGVMNR